jgi:hypothetical protein
MPCNTVAVLTCMRGMKQIQTLDHVPIGSMNHLFYNSPLESRKASDLESSFTSTRLNFMG